MPPIYQPEVIAEAIYAAAHTRRREWFVGISAVKAIIGNKLFPGWLDHYLAKKAYSGQQTDEPRVPMHLTTFGSRSQAITVPMADLMRGPVVLVPSFGSRATGRSSELRWRLRQGLV